MKTFSLLSFLFLFSNLSAATYYVSPNGNDSNPGTLSAPWKTWDKAFSSRSPGDIVYFRGGVYYMTVLNGRGYDKTAVGTPTDSILFLNYPGEKPILDCSSVTSILYDNNQALTLHLTYARVRGLTVRNVWQMSSAKEVQAWAIVGNHAVMDNCVVYNTHGRGFWSIDSHELTFRNCDAYNNCDALTSVLPGNDGYGFFIQDMTSTSRRVYLKNCRAWKNGDDGYACYTNGYVEFDGCWSFYNGQLQGEGHGFKLGWLDLESSSLRRVVKNCLAAWNKSDGINTNDEPGSSAAAVMNVFNNTCYNNTTSSLGGNSFGYIIFNTGSSDAIELGRVFKNNIAYKNYAGNVLATQSALYTHSHNNWDLPVTISDADFISTDTTGLTASRNASGALPDMRGFMKLAPGSDLINAGTNVGLAYSGTAPDLGYSEYSTAVVSSPVYVSSVIENAAPSKLEITFNMSLATVVPPSPAFSVIVNSNARTVSSVSISGAKAILTLASPVVYGDIITVAYNKPSSNPLQGTGGGQVASFSGKQVLNNCVQSQIPVSGITITGAGNLSTITSANGTLQLTASIQPSNASNKNVNWSIVNGTGTATISSTGLVTAVSNGTVTARAIAADGSGVTGSFAITISNQPIKVTSITVAVSSGSATPPVNSTLQLVATVLPSNATNKSVTWSVINGTGQATINSSGLLTTVSNGTITAKATAADGSGVSGTLQITIASSTSAIPVSSITVSPYNNALPKISKRRGKLRMIATILPENATKKAVTWSVESITGSATIDSYGILTARVNGTVNVIATATDGSNVKGYCTVTITNQTYSRYRTYYYNEKLIITTDQTEESYVSDPDNSLDSQASMSLIEEENAVPVDDYPSEVICSIYNMNGALICTKKAHEVPIEIDITDLPSGVYIVTVNNQMEQFNMKVLIP